MNFQLKSLSPNLDSIPSLEEYEKHPLSYSTQLNLKDFDEYIKNFYPEFVSQKCSFKIKRWNLDKERQ